MDYIRAGEVANDLEKMKSIKMQQTENNEDVNHNLEHNTLAHYSLPLF